MMIRFLPALGIVSALTGPSFAQTVEERLIAGLTGEGYTILEHGRTFLGRLRIVAENGTLHREIVVNPSTGEVLRDYAVALADLGGPNLPDGGSHATFSAAAPPTAAIAAASSGVTTTATTPDDGGQF